MPTLRHLIRFTVKCLSSLTLVRPVCVVACRLTWLRSAPRWWADLALAAAARCVPCACRGSSASIALRIMSGIRGLEVHLGQIRVALCSFSAFSICRLP